MQHLPSPPSPYKCCAPVERLARWHASHPGNGEGRITDLPDRSDLTDSQRNAHCTHFVSTRGDGSASEGHRWTLPELCLLPDARRAQVRDQRSEVGDGRVQRPLRYSQPCRVHVHSLEHNTVRELPRDPAREGRGTACVPRRARRRCLSRQPASDTVRAVRQCPYVR